MVKTGFFVQRICGRPAAGKCSVSGQYICKQHAVTLDGEVVSAEVYAQEMRKRNQTVDRADALSSRQEDMARYNVWYYFMREEFYANYELNPLEESDFRAFDEKEALFGGGELGPGEYWDDEGIGFFDS
jgi:hypothetical protein